MGKYKIDKKSNAAHQLLMKIKITLAKISLTTAPNAACFVVVVFPMAYQLDKTFQITIKSDFVNPINL